MRRAILPFPEPRVQDGQSGRRPRICTRSRNPYGWNEALPAVRSNHNPYSLALTLEPFAGALRRAISARTSALAVGPKLRPSGSIPDLRSGDLRSLSLHSGPRLSTRRPG